MTGRLFAEVPIAIGVPIRADTGMPPQTVLIEENERGDAPLQDAPFQYCINVADEETEGFVMQTVAVPSDIPVIKTSRNKDPERLTIPVPVG